MTETGFFYLIDHEVEQKLLKELEADFRWFFSQDLTTKLDLDMKKVFYKLARIFSIRCRTYSGIPDQKEGLYLGKDHSNNLPNVKNKIPTFGSNPGHNLKTIRG